MVRVCMRCTRLLLTIAWAAVLQVKAPQLLTRAPLGPQLTAIREYSSKDVQLDREGGKIGPATLKKLADNVASYLGFLYTYQSHASPTLEAYLEPHAFAGYISYLRAKRSGKGRLSSVIATAQRVVSFLEATGPLQQGALTPLSQWLRKLWRQLNLVTLKSRKDIMAMDAEGRWIDAAAYGRLVEQVGVLRLIGCSRPGHPVPLTRCPARRRPGKP